MSFAFDVWPCVTYNWVSVSLPSLPHKDIFVKPQQFIFALEKKIKLRNLISGSEEMIKIVFRGEKCTTAQGFFAPKMVPKEQ